MSQRKKKSIPPISTTASTPDDATAYARAVVAGDVVAGPDVRNACQRHLNDLANGHERGLVWKPEVAQRVIGYFRDVLKLNGGDFEGIPFDLSLWQKFIVGCLYGWHGGPDDPSGQYRRFRVAYIEAAKGNGKSPLVAGIGHYMLAFDGESRAEVYAAATKKDQAMILFRDAVSMRDQSPALTKRLLKTGGVNCYNLAHIDSGSWFRCISSDDGQSGPRPHCGLVDELHEHKSSVVIDMMRAGTKGRKQALIIAITNSGVDRTSVCYVQHEYSQKVAAGTIVDDTWFAYVCGLDESDDPLNDESCWIKANPNLGVSIPLRYIREQVREAKGMPAKESIVRRLNFCQWTDAANPWIEGAVWMRCEDTTIKDPYADWKGRECIGGLDLSGTTDLTALALAFRRDDGGVDALVEFWTPADTLHDRARRDRVPYDSWARGKVIHTPPGRAVDYGFVAQRMAELQAIFDFTRTAFDPYRIKYLERDLQNAGVEMTLIQHGQGFFKSKESGLWMPRSIDLVEKHIFEKTLHVFPNFCLRWNVASAVMEFDPKNNRAFDKRRAAGRIDGAVALTMAVGALLDTEAPEASVYESRGLVTL